jgi:sugar/nucleoside kinase (ribokinase family)
MRRKFDLLVIGEINPDLVLTGDVTPTFGQVEKMVDNATLSIGSSSCIFACGAARLGLKVAFIGKIGDDEFGQYMRAQMAAREIDVGGIVVDPALKTGLSVILSRGNDRAILTFSGSIAEMRLEDIDFSFFSQAHHLHLGGYFMLSHLQPHVGDIFRRAHSQGMTTSIDTNYDPDEKWSGGLDDALAEANIFLPNETELLAISHTRDVDTGLEKLTAGGRVVAVKLGAKGGAARQSERTIRAPALPIQVVDTTGAGDSFDAGFIYGWLHQWDLDRCLKLACACGSLSTRALGGTSSQPTLDEALKVLS